MRRSGRFHLLLLIAVGAPVPASAQLLDRLEAPSAPGFQILGVHPTAIERPSTPRAFGVSLLSAAESSGSIIPENYAVEVAPYWLSPHPYLSFRERVAPSFWQGLKQSFAVSVATRTDDGGVATGTDSTRIGAGFRVLLLPGRLSEEGRAAKDSLDAIGDALNRLLDRRDSIPDDTPAADSLDARIDSLDVVRQRVGVGLAEFDADRDTGLRWELAAAAATVVPGNRFDRAESAGWGVWSTVSFQPSGAFDVLGVIRYLRLDPLSLGNGPAPADAGERTGGDQDVIDVGARMLWATGSLKLSGELLRRSAWDPDDPSGDVGDATVVSFGDSWRAVANVDYHISPTAALNWTLGRGFALEGIDSGQLIAMLGFKLGLGSGLESFLRDAAEASTGVTPRP